MKKVFITLLCLSISAAAANAQNNKQAPAPTPTPVPASQQAPPAPDPDAGSFKFKDEDNTHDFGEVPEGPLAEYDFEFKNTGKKPIVIQEAHGSCGCTVPSWPHEPILPKQKAVIHVAYTTNGRPGPIMKEVTINSNAKESPMVLHIRGTVKPKPKDPTPPPTAPPAPAPAK
jgi:hypothetical protein